MSESYAPSEFARAAIRDGRNETPVTRCPGSDSNRDALRHCPLKTACLPVPPPGRARNIERVRHEVQAALAKALRCPLSRLARLLFPVPGWGLDRQRIDQPAGDRRHIGHGAVERRLVRVRGMRRAAQLAHEL